ncbi:alpha/beta hydrolase [Dyella solisilvae]|uniref:Alpha/beta hydrolase n=1 Tax=Dyella solisilvae TaxID=1920168 RepID=A0A370K5W0_9GAMM|nr:alpha/beta hydrolase [Dyella solisilvae]RDI98018.1 alpha/beta hydrolase [Dyella solisilvae]
MQSIPTQEYWVNTDHGRLYAKRWLSPAEQANTHPPIVLFHDSLGCVALWRDFPSQLAQATGRDVIAYDRLGFGRSDAHPGKLERDFIRDEARDGVSQLRSQLGIDAFVAFGHSVGGGMAVGCAAAYPTDCTALITESAQAFVEERTLQGIREAQVSFWQPGQIERLARYHGDKASWVLHAWVGTWLAPDFAGWNLDDELRRVTCPVLAIHGDQDEFGSTLQPQRIAARVEGHSTVEIFAGVGHVPHRESTDAVLALVTAWLS